MKSFLSAHISTLAALAALGLAAAPAAHAQQSLYVANVNDGTITKFNSAGIGTQFNSTGNLNGPVALAFYPSSLPAAVPEASTTVSLGLLLALGLSGMVVTAKQRKRA